MLRATTLLIVMVMAGGPAGSLACELMCSGPVAEDHHLAVGCHDAAAMSPFVTEVRHRESAPAVLAPAARFNSMSIGRGHNQTAAGWCVFNVQPSRPPSARDVLRV
jgi:hypothetical protein